MVLDEENELVNQIDELSERGSGNRFGSIAKLAIKKFAYHYIRASRYCKLLKSFCISKSIVNIQNDGKYCSLWCILTDRYKIDNRSEVVLQHKKYFTEFYQDDIQFPIKIKDILYHHLNNGKNSIEMLSTRLLLKKLFHLKLSTDTMMKNK